MKQRHVDLVHVFDHTGMSVLTGEHLRARLASLERENQRLKDTLRRVLERRKHTEGDPDSPSQ